MKSPVHRQDTKSAKAFCIVSWRSLRLRGDELVYPVTHTGRISVRLVCEARLRQSGLRYRSNDAHIVQYKPLSVKSEEATFEGATSREAAGIGTAPALLVPPVPSGVEGSAAEGNLPKGCHPPQGLPHPRRESLHQLSDMSNEPLDLQRLPLGRVAQK
jgi:hypothetical protein